MDWVHCNSCFYQPGDTEKRGLYFTSCGHLYCKSCLTFDNNFSQTCSVCRKQYVVTQINSEMSEDLKENFNDPFNYLNKILKVLKFQKEHRLRFFTHNKQMNLSYQTYKEFCDKAQNEIECLKAKIQRLQEENRHLKQLYYKFHDKSIQTPLKRKSPFNFSPVSSESVYKMSSPFEINSLQFPQTPTSQTIWADRITLPSQHKTN
ncbi:Uncharacterized protein GBIM_01917 [Gryllus bimaculatus]|nr:Uncharacterized protein GBIM_01917 [Gryllus bimaculatus]